MWQGLDANKDGLLTKVEVAEMFGVGHLLLQLPADEQQALLAQEFGPQGADAALDPKGLHNMDMQQLEERLLELHSTKLSSQPGGVLIYFLIWDLCAFLFVLAFLSWKVYTIKSQVGTWEAVLDDWRFGCSLYFCKMLTGFFCLPFLIFEVPVLSSSLTHVRMTGYDEGGSCVPKLKPKDCNIRWAQRRHDMLVRFGTPGYIPGLGEWIEYRWNKFLGGFDDDDGPPPASSSGENGEEDTGAGHDDKEKEAKAKMKADANAQFKARQQQLAKTANIAPEASLIDVNRSRFPDGAERLRVSDPSADNLMVLV